MKRIICLIMAMLVLVLLCGCGSTDTESIIFSQQVTIVTMPSPPKCKTTDNVSVVDEVIEILGKIEKTPTDANDIKGGWEFMIKLSIDKEQFVYTVGNIFTDSDGTQYRVDNYDEIKEKLAEIYSKIDAEEVDYT